REQLVAEDPVRVEDEVFGQVDGVVILDDAAHLNLGQSKGFCQVLQPFGLGNRFVKNLSVEISDGTVRPDGPRPDGGDAAPVLEVGNFDVGVLPSFFRQYLDAEIIVLVGG